MMLPILLCVIGIVAILGEFFIPSAGLIGIGGVAAIIAGIVMVFNDFGNLYGFIFLGANLLIVPAAILFYWKRFPRSFMGKRLILGQASGAAPQEEERKPVAVGATGTAITLLRPAGTAQFGDERLSVVTDGEFLSPGTAVRIEKIEGNRIIVIEENTI